MKQTTQNKTIHSSIKEPFFSVVCTAYNSEKYIKRAMDSCLSQTFEYFEIIVIDDGSSDKTCDIVKKINDGRIKLFTKSNKGAYESRKQGVLLSSGKYLLFLDSDDEFACNSAFQSLYDSIVSNSFPEVVVFNIDIENADSSYFTKKLDFDSASDKVFALKQSLIENKINGLFFKCFSRDILNNPRFSFLEYSYLYEEDLVMSLPFFDCASTFCYLDKSIYFYHYNDTSLIRTSSKRKVRDVANQKSLDLLINYSKKWGLDDSTRLKIVETKFITLANYFRNVCHFLSWNDIKARLVDEKWSSIFDEQHKRMLKELNLSFTNRRIVKSVFNESFFALKQEYLKIRFRHIIGKIIK